VLKNPFYHDVENVVGLRAVNKKKKKKIAPVNIIYLIRGRYSKFKNQ
jgi:hypothetical protein